VVLKPVLLLSILSVFLSELGRHLHAYLAQAATEPVGGRHVVHNGYGLPYADDGWHACEESGVEHNVEALALDGVQPLVLLP